MFTAEVCVAACKDIRTGEAEYCLEAAETPDKYTTNRFMHKDIQKPPAQATISFNNDLQIKAFCGYYTINYHKLQESVVNFMRLYNSSADDARVFVSL